MLFLVTGARGATKSNVRCTFNRFYDVRRWTIYSNKFNILPLPWVCNVSIARKIREEVAFEKNFEDDNNYDDLKKTVLMGNITYRDLLNSHAQSKINGDPEYFIRNCYNWKAWVKDPLRRSLIVTDWRYETELEYLKRLKINPTTLRVVNSTDEEQELECDHALDNFETDFQMVSGINHNIKKILEKFPQYAGLHGCSTKKY